MHLFAGIEKLNGIANMKNKWISIANVLKMGNQILILKCASSRDLQNGWNYTNRHLAILNSRAGLEIMESIVSFIDRTYYLR